MDSSGKIKDARLVASGKKGAASRWGPARIVRIDDLSAPQRTLVLALIAAVRANRQVEP